MIGFLFFIAIVTLGIIFRVQLAFVLSFAVTWLWIRLRGIAFVAFCLLLLSIILLIFGVGLNLPTMTGIAFLIMAALFFTVCTATGFTLERFGIISKTWSSVIGGFMFWLCSSGALLMLFPKITYNVSFLVYSGLFFIVVSTFGTIIGKFNKAPHWCMMILVIVASASGLLKILSPDNFAKLEKKVVGRGNLVFENFGGDGEKDQLDADTKIGETAGKIVTAFNMQKQVVTIDLAKGQPVEISFIEETIDGWPVLKIREFDYNGDCIGTPWYYVPKQKVVWETSEMDIFTDPGGDYVVKKKYYKNGTEVWEISLRKNYARIDNLPIGKKYQFSGFEVGDIKTRGRNKGKFAAVSLKDVYLDCPQALEIEGRPGLIIIMTLKKPKKA